MRLTDSDSETECNSGSVHQSCTSSPKSVLPLSSEGRGKKKSHCPNHFLYQKTTGLILKLDCVQEKCPEKQRQPFYLNCCSNVQLQNVSKKRRVFQNCIPDCCTVSISQVIKRILLCMFYVHVYVSCYVTFIFNTCSPLSSSH